MPLLRTAMYPEAYHHVTLSGDRGERRLQRVDVVGSLCENNDKLAVQRAAGVPTAQAAGEPNAATCAPL